MNPKLSLLVAILVVSLTLAVFQGQSVSDEKQAGSIVQKFAQFDFDGYRLGSAGHTAIWDLTIDDGAPPEFPILLIKAFRLGASEKLADGSIRVPVEYDAIGTVTEGSPGHHFRSQSTVTKALFPLKCMREGCKIDLD